MHNNKHELGISALVTVGWLLLIAGLIYLPKKQPVAPQDWDYKMYRKSEYTDEITKNIIAEPERVYQSALRKVHRKRTISLFLITVGGITILATGFALSEKHGHARVIDAAPSAVRTLLCFLRLLASHIFSSRKE